MTSPEHAMVIPAVILVFGASYAIALPHWLLRPIQDHLWMKVLRHNLVPESAVSQDVTFLPAILGIIERALYLGSILVKQPEFIAVWLAIKVAGGFRAWSEGRSYACEDNGQKVVRTVPGSQVFTAYLIGTANSLLFAAVGAYSIRWAWEGQYPLALATAASVIIGIGVLLAWAKHDGSARSAP